MDPGMFARGFVLGFTIAAAVGPISLLVMRRTLAEGRVVGIVSGLGVATADAVFGAVAAFGLTAVTDIVIGTSRALAIVGGITLVVIGWRTASTEPDDARVDAPRRAGLAGAYGSILGLTLTNPMTILSFAAVFAGLGISGRPADAALLTLGVFGGSAGWWLVLTGVVGRLRGRIARRGLRRVSVASGVGIVAFGVIALANGLRG